MNYETISQSFSSYFNAKPKFIVRAPGRVNLIGEHTDYNDGFVLPMAIDREVCMALSPRDDETIRLFSLDVSTRLNTSLKTDSVFNLPSLTPSGGWIEYPKGVANQLLKAGYQLKGFDAVITGDVPQGAGLSSSAALELATAKAFAMSSGFEWDAVEMSKLCQKAENEWVGVNSGIMDQMASAACKAGYAMFLDCRSLEIQHVPLPQHISVVILDTSTRRGLVESAYNERRSQCEEAARWFEVKALRDVRLDSEKWKVESGKMKEERELVFKRARHVISENERVLEAMQVMKDGNVKRLGELFNESHESLKNDFEVTNEALN
ncbi:MAG: galactokinase, partial [Anaerolineales bacterium]|nr:galactokinase [Anaerolineales bacterium]